MTPVEMMLSAYRELCVILEERKLLLERPKTHG